MNIKVFLIPPQAAPPVEPTVDLHINGLTMLQAQFLRAVFNAGTSPDLNAVRDAGRLCRDLRAALTSCGVPMNPGMVGVVLQLPTTFPQTLK